MEEWTKRLGGVPYWRVIFVKQQRIVEYELDVGGEIGGRLIPLLLQLFLEESTITLVLAVKAG